MIHVKIVVKNAFAIIAREAHHLGFETTRIYLN